LSPLGFAEQKSVVCCAALELCRLLQAEGFFRQRGYDTERRVSVSFVLAPIKSICKDEVGGFNGEDIYSPLLQMLLLWGTGTCRNISTASCCPTFVPPAGKHAAL